MDIPYCRPAGGLKAVFLRTVILRMSILKPTYLDLGVRYSVPFDVILKLRVSSIQISNNM